MLVTGYRRVREIHVVFLNKHQVLLFIVIKITTTSHKVFLSHESLAWDTCWQHGSVRGCDTHFEEGE